MSTARKVYELRKLLGTAQFERQRFENQSEDAQRNGAAGTLGDYRESQTFKQLTAAIETAEANLAAAQSEIGGRVYRVPVENLYSLEQRVEKINRRVKKTGSQPVALKVTEETDRQERKEHGAVVEVIDWVYVILSGQTAMIGGWDFVAVIQHTEEGNVIREIPAIRQETMGVTPSDLTGYLKVDANCDHCGLDRRRKDTYLLQERTTGTLKQIGRNCLGDFSGIHNPDRFAKYAEYLIDFDAAMEEGEREPGFGGGTPVTSLETYLTQVVTMIRERGWISGSKAYEYGDISTKVAASDNISKCRRGADDAVLSTAEDRAEAQTAIEWARENYTEAAVDAAIAAGNTDEAQFINNMRVATAADYIGARLEGYAAYTVMARRRSIEKVVREEKAANAREGKGYIGEVGQKGLEVKVTLVSITEMQDNYSYNGGTKPLYTFLDADGNDVKWFSSKWIDELEQGHEYVIRGTVKSHDDGTGTYGDKNYPPATVLTRVKIMEIL